MLRMWNCFQRPGAGQIAKLGEDGAPAAPAAGPLHHALPGKHPGALGEGRAGKGANAEATRRRPWRRPEVEVALIDAEDRPPPWRRGGGRDRRD